MKSFMISALLFIFLPFGTLNAQDFSGTYSTHVDGETITLNLVSDTDDKVTGTMDFEGDEYTIEGQRQGDRMEGLMKAFDEAFGFSARLTNNNLLVTLSEP
jgi:hypothetical protein